MFRLFSKTSISQASLVPALNKIKDELKDVSSFDAGGICSSLCNTYIKYSSEKKRETFFKKINLAITRKKDSPLAEDLSAFFTELEDAEQADGIYLERECHDTFAFLAFNQRQLRSNISRIIEYFQHFKTNRYAHVTLGHTHSFVLEQHRKGDSFVYFVYDPNNPDLPLGLTTIDEIIAALNNIIKRIQLSTCAFYQYLTDNKNLLFTFYVYSEIDPEKKDDLIPRLQKKIGQLIESFSTEYKNDCDLILMAPDAAITFTTLPETSRSAYVLRGDDLLFIEKDPNVYRVINSEIHAYLPTLIKQLTLFLPTLKEGEKQATLLEKLSAAQLNILLTTFNIKHEPSALLDLYDAEWAIEKYLHNKISKGVLLSNLLTLPDLLDEEKEIKKMLKDHLLSSDFLTKDFKDAQCYPYIGNGNTSLFHEIARIGDLQTARCLFKVSNPLWEDNINFYPLKCAIMEGFSRISREIFNFMYHSNQKHGEKHYDIPYEALNDLTYKYLGIYSYKDALYTGYQRNLNFFNGRHQIEGQHKDASQKTLQLKTI